MTDQPPVICAFESRRSEEMRSLIERFGGIPLVAPSMQEVPIAENSDALNAIRKILTGYVNHLVLLTGVGTEAMLDVADTQQLRPRLIEAMQSMPILVRGPKPAAVLSRLGLKYAVKAPAPNTWQDLLNAVDDVGIRLKNQTVAVQEYGIPNPELYEALQSRGANVLPIPVYRWALPDDIGPLQQAVQKTIAGELDALLFTSAQQIRHVLQVAEQMEVADDWRQAVSNLVIGSIGPTCSDTLRELQLPVTVEASPPKMGPLVRAVAGHLKEHQE